MILQKMFEPATIKGLKVKNRLVVPAMHTNLGNRDEGITDRAIEYYLARAKGGFGMVGVGIIDSHPFEWSSPLELLLQNKQHVRRHAELVKAAKDYGTVIYAQIGIRRIWPLHEMRTFPKLSTIPAELIERMVASVIESAVRAREAGYDAVDLLGVGGGGISIFLSEVFNDRTDTWGGSFENRLRFPMEMLRGIRRELGDDYPVFFRLHGGEFLPKGYTNETAKRIAKALADAGVSFFNVTGGSHATSVPQLTPNVPRGAFAFLAREIKSAVQPQALVAASNRINHPVIAEEILRKGWADFVSLGRASLADPDWPRKALEGEFEDIRLCVACNECLDAATAREKEVRCLVNPKVGRVSERAPLPAASKSRKVVVVGGGIAGLQAALSCAERGHRVSLYDKESYLGGKWRASFVTAGRGELLNFLYWLSRQVKRAGVNIHLATEVTPELVRDIAPDAVIVTTGAKPRIPAIRGADLPHVVFAHDVLEGKVQVGPRATVIGGGGVGVETAIYLAQRWAPDRTTLSFLREFAAMENESTLVGQKHDVTLVGRNPSVGKGLGPGTRWVLRRELESSGVHTLAPAEVTEIRRDGVVARSGKEDAFIPADTVVLAVGYVSDDSLYQAIKNIVPETYTLGNAAEVQHAIAGTGAALELALKI
ncbi:MAG: NAD(P)/FAD-dependent oxidoreductase [Chloroflexi bacterium]|nr:NAD(P)/FAD-dependent oxidoreductase [Chloroflexota bacterium]